MATASDTLSSIPVWQRILVWVLGAAAIAAIWYFFYWTDLQRAHDSASMSLQTARTELAEVKDRKQNFLEQQRELEQAQSEIDAQRKVLPMSSSTVDNLMQTFQQKARLLGLTVESWTPGEEEQQDYYARLPVEVRATGSWPQMGEFFRQVAEMQQIVSVENVSMRVPSSREIDSSGHPKLDVSFEVATYRLLTPEEREALQGDSRRRRRRD